MPSKIFFTSDLHLFHRNVVDYCNRPFPYEQQTSILVDNWNAVVKPEDEVYLLGDISLGEEQETIEALRLFKGKKYLIAGNHDRRLLKTKVRDEFEWVRDIHELHIPEAKTGPGVWRGYRKVVLCHFPMLTWHKSHFGSFQLCGHTHNNLPLRDDPQRLQLDVGVDGHNYTPITYEQVCAILAPKIAVWKAPQGRHKAE